MGESDPILNFIAAGGSIEIAGFGNVFPKSWYKRPVSDTAATNLEASVHRLVPTGALRRL